MNNATETTMPTRDEINEMYRKEHALAQDIQKLCEKALDENLAKAGLSLTTKQRRVTIAALCAVFKCSALLDAAASEWKRFEVEADEHSVYVLASCGLKGDEGTLAEYFSRYHAQFWVTPRGGITTYGKDAKRLNGKAALRYIGSYVR